MQPSSLEQKKYFIKEPSMTNIPLINSVSLKNLTQENLEDFFLWASDPEVTEHMTWDTYTSKDEALKFLINIAEPHPYFKAIVFEGKVVGSITLSRGKGSSQSTAELGYVLARKYWGRGITTIGAVKAIEEGFSKLLLTRIEALVDPDNIASQRVLEKAGMKQEGLLKNHISFKGQIRDRLLYSITR
jgi:RimJ/RimL family protein N-acetyltransferase